MKDVLCVCAGYSLEATIVSGSHCRLYGVRQPLSVVATAGYATVGCLWLIGVLKAISDLGLTVRLGRLPNS